MRATLITLLCSAFFAVGCQQGVGDRCVQNSDCSSGFCSTNGGNPQGGVCRSTSSAGTPDASQATGGSPGAGGEAGQGGAGGQGGEAGAAAGQGGSATDASVD
jgi:hypothetical protein